MRARHDDGGPDDRHDADEYCPRCRVLTPDEATVSSPYCSAACKVACEAEAQARDRAWCDELAAELAQDAVLLRLVREGVRL